jgi:ligand-binding sensor domain-containing protein
MKRTLLFYFLLTSCISVFGQQNDPENWRYFVSMEKVKCHAETDEMVWLGTEHGLVRIQKDNNERTIWTVHNSNLPSDDIETIQIDADGNVWIGTYDYILMRQDGTGWTEIDIPFDENWLGSSLPLLYDLEIAEDGSFWLGTNNGLWHWKNGTWEVFNSLSGNLSNGPNNNKFWQVEELNGKIYFSEKELFEKNNTETINLTDLYPALRIPIGRGYLSTSNNKVIVSNKYNYVASIDDGNISINTSIDDVFPTGTPFQIATNNASEITIISHIGDKYQLQSNGWISQTTPLTDALIPSNFSRRYYFIDDNNQDWVTDRIQLHRIQNSSLQSFSISDNPLEDNSGKYIAPLSNGSVYIKDYPGKLFLYHPLNGWSSIPVPDDIDGQNFTLSNMTVDPSDHLWICSNRGLLRYDGNDWTAFTQNNSNFPFAEGVGRITSGSDGKIYLATWTNGIVVYDGLNWSTISPSVDGLLAGVPKNIGIAPNGDLWVLVNQTIQHFDGTSWTNYNEQNSIIPPDIGLGNIVFTPNGDLWMSAGSPGVLRFSGNEWTRFGGIVEPSVNIATAFAITISPDEKVWAGTPYNVAVFENDQWSAMDQNNSLILNQRVEKIQAAVNGSIWMNSESKGLYVYNPSGFGSPSSTKNIASDELIIYPNPSNHFININLPSGKQYELFQSNGKLISTGVLQNNRINIEHLASGLYFIRLFSDQGFSVGKFVVE